MPTTLTTSKNLQNNVYTVTLTTAFQQSDLDLMSDFSQPTVDVGGSFTGPPAFTLNSSIKKIKDQFPVVQSFDGASDVDAKDKANVWASEMLTRIQSAVTTLRLNVDDFTGDTVDTL